MRKDQLLLLSRATSFVPVLCALALLAPVSACIARDEQASRDELLRWEIVATHAHDTRAFTQGLAMLDGELVESRGLHGASAVTIGAVAGGAPRLRRDNDARHFGEGIAVAGRTLVQLTWRSGLALVYDERLRKTGEFRYEGEGWGLAYDGRQWLMSNGSDRIQQRRLEDFGVTGELRVTYRGRPLRQLNELEFAHGRLYANVWMSDRVAVIDPGSGRVEAWLDLAPLRRGFARPAGWSESDHVLNGIAWDPARDHFYVTGKCWPVLYEIRLVPEGA
jgi:glutaminyl-peptide cyclotransferase